MYSFRWELDLTDINNKTITTTVIATKGNQKGEIFKSAAKFPDAYQGNVDNVGTYFCKPLKFQARAAVNQKYMFMAQAYKGTTS